MSLRNVVVSMMALAGCGGDDGGSGAAACEVVSSCVAEAITALQACAPTAALALGTPTNNSGVVDNLRCTAGEQTVVFSTFSFSPTGTVPLPSSTTLATAGATCVVIKTGTGSRMDANGTRTFEFSTIELPGANPVTIKAYDNGDVGLECDGPEEVIASASEIGACSPPLQRPVVTRNADITEMSVQLTGTTGAQTELFTCTR